MDFSNMTKAEISEKAAEHGLSLDDADKKADMIAALKAHLSAGQDNPNDGIISVVVTGQSWRVSVWINGMEWQIRTGVPLHLPAAVVEVIERADGVTVERN